MGKMPFACKLKGNTPLPIHPLQNIAEFSFRDKQFSIMWMSPLTIFDIPPTRSIEEKKFCFSHRRYAESRKVYGGLRRRE
jgi:hypothetical protein